jgi:predicted DNA-binding transcriptional regulator AlpA
MSEEKYIGLNEVCILTKLTRRTIYNMEKRNFPKRVKIIPGKNIPVYCRREVEQWAHDYLKSKLFSKNSNKKNIYDILIDEYLGSTGQGGLYL